MGLPSAGSEIRAISAFSEVAGFAFASRSSNAFYFNDLKSRLRNCAFYLVEVPRQLGKLPFYH